MYSGRVRIMARIEKEKDRAKEKGKARGQGYSTGKLNQHPLVKVKNLLFLTYPFLIFLEIHSSAEL